MKLGLMGLPQTGKKSLFELLTGNSISPTDGGEKIISGIANIKDGRFEKLVKMYEPKKEVPARIEIELLPKIEQNSIEQGKIFHDIADMDALCHIVRAFNDDSVYHIKGSVNPKRDIEEINSELLLHDLIFIEKRMERIEKSKKSQNDKSLEIEKELLARFQEHLEKDLPLRTLEISEEDEKIISSYPFITRKKMLIVLNTDEEQLSDNSTIEKFEELYKNIDIEIMQVSVKVESEISTLDDPQEKQEFMEALGITQPALNILSSLAIKTLNLQSFFTVGKDEVRQWTIKIGSSAPIAAGAIHTDIQRGFIRAEVIKYSELIELGSEEELKKAGKLYVMGKDYIVEDGDIINFRFNV